MQSAIPLCSKRILEVDIIIRLSEPERANLLTLILYGFFSSRIRKGGITHGRFLRGSIAIRTGDMTSEIVFREGEITLSNSSGKRSSTVTGEMSSFLKLIKGSALREVLSGRIRLSGNPFLLLSFYLFTRKLK